MSIKYMDIRNFVSLGYLQELNRQFLHPLGLALEVVVENDGSMYLGGIWDYREDPEGMCYAPPVDNVDLEDRCRKRNFIRNELGKRMNMRLKSLGYDIQPIG